MRKLTVFVSVVLFISILLTSCNTDEAFKLESNEFIIEMSRRLDNNEITERVFNHQLDKHIRQHDYLDGFDENFWRNFINNSCSNLYRRYTHESCLDVLNSLSDMSIDSIKYNTEHFMSPSKYIGFCTYRTNLNKSVDVLMDMITQHNYVYTLKLTNKSLRDSIIVETHKNVSPADMTIDEHYHMEESQPFIMSSLGKVVESSYCLSEIISDDNIKYIITCMDGSLHLFHGSDYIYLDNYTAKTYDLPLTNVNESYCSCN